MGYTSSKDDEATLPEDFKPTKYDVIVGWARQNYHHEGNQLLRDIVKENVPRYMGAQSKHDKGAVIVEILERIQRDSPSGYGLVRQHQDTGRWHYIGTDKAKDKIGHALRKAARDIEKSNPAYAAKSASSGSMTSSFTVSKNKIPRRASSGSINNRTMLNRSNGSPPCGRGSLVNLSSSGPETLSSTTSSARDRSLVKVASMPNLVSSSSSSQDPIPAQVTVPSSPVRSNSSTSLHDIEATNRGLPMYRTSQSPYRLHQGHHYGGASPVSSGAGHVESPNRFSPSHLRRYDHNSPPYNYRQGSRSASLPPPPPPPPPPHSASRYDPRHYQYHYYFHHQHHHHHYEMAGYSPNGKFDDGYGHTSSSATTYLPPPTERSVTSLSSPSKQHHYSRNTSSSQQDLPDPENTYSNTGSRRKNSLDEFTSSADFDPIPVTSTDLSSIDNNNNNRDQAERHTSDHQPFFDETAIASDNANSQRTHRRDNTDLSGFGGASFHILEPDDVATRRHDPAHVTIPTTAATSAADFEPVPLYSRNVSENESMN